MIKKQQKWIALLVVCTFMWLMQVSTMPVAAAGTTEQISSANAEQGPDYYEAVSQKAAPAKKKSMLPIILIGVGLVAVTAAVLFLVVLNKYDIVGTWSLTYIATGVGTFTYDTVFTGTKKSGTVVMAGTTNGLYTVDGKKVSCYVAYGSQKWEFIGEFTSKTHMSGQFNYYWDNVIQPQWGGTFSADKK
jgi:hypothetical protein